MPAETQSLTYREQFIAEYREAEAEEKANETIRRAKWFRGLLRRRLGIDDADVTSDTVRLAGLTLRYKPSLSGGDLVLLGTCPLCGAEVEGPKVWTRAELGKLLSRVFEPAEEHMERCPMVEREVGLEDRLLATLTEWVDKRIAQRLGR